jgi:hypothetical protein
MSEGNGDGGSERGACNAILIVIGVTVMAIVVVVFVI